MPLENPSYVFGEDIASSLIVKASTVAGHTVLKCGFGEMPIGVTHEGSREAPIPGVTPYAALSGESARVYGLGENCEVQVATNTVITAGFPVMADSSSKARRGIHGMGCVGIAQKTVTGPGRCRVQVRPHVFDNRNTVSSYTQADTPVTVNDYDSGSQIQTGSASSGQVTLSMPPAVVGLEYSFRVGAAQELRIDPNGTETIALPSTGVQGAAGKYLTADAAGERVHIRCNIAGKWDVISYNGTWTAEA